MQDPERRDDQMTRRLNLKMDYQLGYFHRSSPTRKIFPARDLMSWERLGVAASPVEMYSLPSGPNFNLPPLLNKAPAIFSISTFSESILFLFSVIAKTLLYNFPEDS